MISILHNQNKTYFNVATLTGSFGTIEQVDDYFRAEYYGGHPLIDHKKEEMDFLVYLQDCPMFTLETEFKTLQEAFEALVEEIEPLLPIETYFQKIKKHLLNNKDWLLNSAVVTEEDLAADLLDWIKLMNVRYLAGHSKELRREAEYYEAYENDTATAGGLYDRADFMLALKDILNKED